MKLSKSDRGFLLTLLILLLFLFVALYFNVVGGKSEGGLQEVGTIYFKNREAERKPTSQMIWQNLETSMPVYNRDAIRTAEQSQATIVLLDGTEIDLDENTLILLTVSKGMMDLNFSKGSIHARKEGTNSALNITSDNKSVSVTDGDLSLESGKEDMKVTVNRGEASLKTFSSSGTGESAEGNKTGTAGSTRSETKSLKQNQTASLNKKGSIDVKNLILIPQEPAAGTRMFTNKAGETLTFRWNQPDNIREVMIEVSDTPSFKTKVVQKKVNGKTTQAYLKEGAYYWRLVALNPATNKIESSNVTNLGIFPKSNIQPASPKEASKFLYKVAEPSIRFAWTSGGQTGKYHITIASDPNLQNIVKKSDLFINTVNFSLPAGKYYWSVQTVGGYKDNNSSTPVRSFIVEQTDRPIAPTPMRPAYGTIFGNSMVTSAGVLFNWNHSPEINQTLLEISKNDSFSKDAIIRAVTVNTNSYLFRQSIPDGKYYWRLQGIIAQDDRSNYSEALSFTVQHNGEIALSFPVTGHLFETLDTKQEGIDFSWKRSVSEGMYKLTITKEGKTVKESDSPYSSVRVDALPLGIYQWKVTQVSSTGAAIAQSGTNTFIVRKILPDPPIIHPAANQKIDMTSKDSILFKWGPSKGATVYFVKLYIIDKHKKTATLIDQTTTDKLQYEFKDLNKLDIGNFYWSIETVEEPGSIASPRSKVKTIPFQILLSENPGQPEVTSPDTQFVRIVKSLPDGK